MASSLPRKAILQYPESPENSSLEELIPDQESDLLQEDMRIIDSYLQPQEKLQNNDHQQINNFEQMNHPKFNQLFIIGDQIVENSQNQQNPIHYYKRDSFNLYQDQSFQNYNDNDNDNDDNSEHMSQDIRGMNQDREVMLDFCQNTCNHSRNNSGDEEDSEDDDENGEQDVIKFKSFLKKPKINRFQKVAGASYHPMESLGAAKFNSNFSQGRSSIPQFSYKQHSTRQYTQLDEYVFPQQHNFMANNYYHPQQQQLLNPIQTRIQWKISHSQNNNNNEIPNSEQNYHHHNLNNIRKKSELSYENKEPKVKIEQEQKQEEKINIKQEDDILQNIKQEPQEQKKQQPVLEFITPVSKERNQEQEEEEDDSDLFETEVQKELYQKMKKNMFKNLTHQILSYIETNKKNLIPYIQGQGLVTKKFFKKYKSKNHRVTNKEQFVILFSVKSTKSNQQTAEIEKKVLRAIAFKFLREEMLQYSIYMSRIVHFDIFIRVKHRFMRLLQILDSQN